jgi:uncharacterized protein YacL
MSFNKWILSLIFSYQLYTFKKFGLIISLIISLIIFYIFIFIPIFRSNFIRISPHFFVVIFLLFIYFCRTNGEEFFRYKKCLLKKQKTLATKRQPMRVSFCSPICWTKIFDLFLLLFISQCKK